MKTEQIVTIVAGAVLAFVAVQVYRKRAGTTAKPADWTSAINNQALPGQPGWGWQYFTDGTVIRPDGAYVRDGVVIWTPPAA